MICRRGIIYLVGAGPGDPDLITVRGMRLIQQADTIIHDRLIPPEVLQWARPEALLIDVGKYPDHHRVSQAEINDLARSLFDSRAATRSFLVVLRKR